MLPTRTLSKDDVVYFMHVPKTAGTSFVNVLAGYFSKKEFFPFGLPNYLKRYEKPELEAYRCFHGHYLYLPLAEYLPKAPTCRLTMLRDPLHRTASYYRHMQSEKPSIHFYQANSLDLGSFLNDANVRAVIEDLQTRFLLWEGGGRCGGPDDEESLETAKKELISFDFFGVTERFEESMLLMAFLLRLQPPAETPRLNRRDTMANRWTTSTGRLVELFTDELRRANRLDLPLYAYAVEVFERRYREMLDVLSEGHPDRLAGDLQQTRRALRRWLDDHKTTGQHRHRIVRQTASAGDGSKSKRRRFTENASSILNVPFLGKKERSRRPGSLSIEIETVIEQPAGHCGWLDQIVLCEDGVTLHARGWAYDPAELRPAEEVLIVAGSSQIRSVLQKGPDGVCFSASPVACPAHRIIGHAEVDRPREDVLKNLHNRRVPLAAPADADLGWEARFRIGLLENGDTFLRAYVYSPKRRMMIHIGPELEIPQAWLKKAGKKAGREAA